ncbi:MAG TPA: phage tail protein I [Rummeliibacillus sp.]|nr:phage tail protein I [Rummeliibacillus sp.]
MSKQITDLLLVDALPAVLRNDKFSKALTKAVNVQLNKLFEQAMFYVESRNLMDMPEAFLDHLAYTKYVEYYSFSMSKQEKVNAINSSSLLHKQKGTPSALTTVLKTLNFTGYAEEWFQYDGDPYMFKVWIESNGTDITVERLQILEKLIQKYKNNRSHLEVLNIYASTHSNINYAATTATGESITVYPWTPKTIELSANTRFGAAVINTTEVFTVYPKEEGTE